MDQTCCPGSTVSALIRAQWSDPPPHTHTHSLSGSYPLPPQLLMTEVYQGVHLQVYRVGDGLLTSFSERALGCVVYGLSNSDTPHTPCVIYSRYGINTP